MFPLLLFPADGLVLAGGGEVWRRGVGEVGVEVQITGAVPGIIGTHRTVEQVAHPGKAVALVCGKRAKGGNGVTLAVFLAGATTRKVCAQRARIAVRYAGVAQLAGVAGKAGAGRWQARADIGSAGVAGTKACAITVIRAALVVVSGAPPVALVV